MNPVHEPGSVSSAERIVNRLTVGQKAHTPQELNPVREPGSLPPQIAESSDGISTGSRRPPRAIIDATIFSWRAGMRAPSIAPTLSLVMEGITPWCNV
jgi:hypothetical protein